MKVTYVGAEDATAIYGVEFAHGAAVDVSHLSAEHRAKLAVHPHFQVETVRAPRPAKER